MPALGLALGLPFVRKAAGPGVVYTRTAFVSSSGNDGTGALNTLGSPYLTLGAAVTALHGAYAGQTTTLRLLTNLATGLSNSAALNNLLTAGLTIRAHEATVRSIGDTVSFGANANALLTLSKVTLSSLLKVGHTTDAAESAGTITGDADTTITVLNIDADNHQNGATGDNGGTSTGGNGGNGADGDPPSSGESGGSAGASGTSGAVGSTRHAWNLTLAGSGLCSNLFASGASGGDGGTGGIGGSATGGNGGAGGNSTSAETQDGAPGGSGGSASANGGAGGNGGNGGNGGTITKSAGWTISSSTLLGGAAGLGGAGGNPGSATGGTGGAGGAGANGGSAGANGDNGSASADQGSAGSDGTAGADGSII